MADRCIFCNIAQGRDPQTTILYQDEEVVVFRDIKPAAPHHYLAIPREHIQSAKKLKHNHISLVESLHRAGQRVLEEQGGDPSQARYGFHWPPLVLISHLHLHIIGPQSSIGFLGRMLFRPNSYWFSSVEWVLERLKKMPPEDEMKAVSGADEAGTEADTEAGTAAGIEAGTKAGTEAGVSQEQSAGTS